MSHLQSVSLVAASLVIGTGFAFAQAADPNPPSDTVVQYARDFVAANLIGNAALNEAIVASTEKHERLGYDELRIMDGQWRVAKSGVETERNAAKLLGELVPETSIDDQIKAGEALIAAATGNDISKWLIEVQQSAEPEGAITEIFVMDGWGWNVAQTGGTSDYYQGDEGKWQKTYFLDGIEVLDIVEEDGLRYAQISLPIKDGDANIGAVTVGVDVDKVQ